MSVQDRKDTTKTGRLGEMVAAEYLTRCGFSVVARNVHRKTGEIDIVVEKAGCLHLVEVKSAEVIEFPSEHSNSYDPAMHIHEAKLRRLARTGEWYVSNIGWAGGWQVDAVLVRIRKRDGIAQVRYIPQIV